MIDIKELCTIIYDNTGITLAEIKYRSRKRKYMTPRIILSFILYTYLRQTYKDIGNIIGNRDHTTIMHYLQKHQDFIEVDKAYKTIYDAIFHECIRRRVISTTDPKMTHRGRNEIIQRAQDALKTWNPPDWNVFLNSTLVNKKPKPKRDIYE